MNIFKRLLAGLVLLSLTAFSVAHAELRLGGQFDYGKGEITGNGDLFDGSLDDSTAAYNLFGEWRTDSSNATSWGVNVGVGNGGSEWQGNLFTLNVADTNAVLDLVGARSGVANTAGTIGADVTAEADSTLDLLGVFAWNRPGITPYIKFGYTSVKVESNITLVTPTDFTPGAMFTPTGSTTAIALGALDDTVVGSASGTLKGWKLAGGIEGKFSTNWRWHSAVEYADYGDETLTHTIGGIPFEDKIELDRLSWSFGVAYVF